VKSTLQNDIDANSAELRALNQAIWSAFARRSRSPADCRVWQAACWRFREARDRLAFPGGLTRGMVRLAEGDPTSIETSIRFLEADPWFFRSGYIKADIIRHLRRVPLSPAQIARLRRVILARVASRDTREFRWYCRLARLVADPDFRQEIERLSGSPVAAIARRAGWVAAQIGARSKA
jgi:hypothetical protein